ncbi:MAG: PepSY domain-containing protein [Bacillota bacterium]|nr:PepSY domain-containing protein [Bacillota bacterium]
MKKIAVLLVILAMALPITACTQKKQEYIGEKAAKKVITDTYPDADISKFEFKKDKKPPVYVIDFGDGDLYYEASIDALTGEIITLNEDKDKDKENKDSEDKGAAGETDTTDSTGKAEKEQYIGMDKAIDIAVSDAGEKVNSVMMIDSSETNEDDKEIYEIKFKANNCEYTYKIDAASGDIINKDTDLDI